MIKRSHDKDRMPPKYLKKSKDHQASARSEGRKQSRALQETLAALPISHEWSECSEVLSQEAH